MPESREGTETGKTLRGLTIVISQHSAESLSALDRAGFSSGSSARLDQSIAQSLMVALAVVVRKVFPTCVPQGSLAEKYQAVQALEFE